MLHPEKMLIEPDAHTLKVKTNEKFALLETNQLFRETFNVVPVDYLGKTFFEVIGANENAAFSYACETCLHEPGTTVNLEVHTCSEQGIERWFRWSLFPRLEGAKTIDFEGIDITALKLQERDLLQQARMFECMSDAVVIVNSAGAILNINLATESLLNSQRSALRGQSFFNLPSRQFLDCNVTTVLMQLQQFGVWAGKVKLTTPTRDILLDERINCVYGPGKSITGYIAVSRIVAKLSNEEKTSARKKIDDWKAIADTSGLAVWEWNIGRETIEVSGVTADLLKLSSSSRHLTVRDWLKLVHPEDRRDFVRQARIQNHETETYHEIQTRFLCGATFKWLLSKTAIVKKDVTGKIVRLAGYLTDVTSRKKAADLDDDRQRRYQQSFESVCDNAWEHDFRTNITIFAGGINEILGYGNAETGDHKQLWWNSMHPDDLPMLDENDRKYRAGLIDNHQLEYRVVARDGQVKWVLDRGAVIERNADGKPVRIIGMHKDITERKTFESALEESERRFSDLAQSVPGVIYQWEERFDGSFGFTYVSPKLKEYFNIEPEQMHLVSAMIHPDDERRWRQSIEHSNRTGTPWHFEGRLLYPDGSIKWWRGNSTLSSISNKGRIYNGIMIDITADQLAKQKIHESEERFKAIFHSMFQFMGMLTPDGTVLEVNNAALDFAGLTLAQVQGKSIADIVKYMFTDNEIEKLNELLKRSREGEFIRFETRAYDRHGEKAWLDFSIKPVRDAEDNVVRLLAEARNITAQKLLQKQLTRQEREKKEAIVEAVIQAQEREREQISVELHDNVNQILSSSRLMLDVAELYPDKTLELVNESKQNVDKAIEEIRKISYSLNPSTVAYVGVCSAITDMVEQVKLTGILDVHFEIRGDWKNAVINGDVELALFRITQEQLNNIIRHAHATNVHITLSIHSSAITILIADDGQGFNPHSMKKGLGLRNIYNRVEHYRGTILLESEPGKGCVLQAMLPITKKDR